MKENYNEELYRHFKEEFYNILYEGKSREIYSRATKYIGGIYELNDGKRLVDDIIKELSKSDYQKCSALFDEIDKEIKCKKGLPIKI